MASPRKRKPAKPSRGEQVAAFFRWLFDPRACHHDKLASAVDRLTAAAKRLDRATDRLDPLGDLVEGLRATGGEPIKPKALKRRTRK